MVHVFFVVQIQLHLLLVLLSFALVLARFTSVARSSFRLLSGVFLQLLFYLFVYLVYARLLLYFSVYLFVLFLLLLLPLL